MALTKQNKKILDHIWIPEIYIPHQGLTKCRHGEGFYDEVVNFLVKNGSILVDYWSLLKPVITCPMVFNWFPFDEQNCNFKAQVEERSNKGRVENRWNFLFLPQTSIVSPKSIKDKRYHLTSV